MKIFGIRPMSTWDKFENLMKIMQDNERLINKNGIENSVTKNIIPKHNENLGKVIDKQA